MATSANGQTAVKSAMRTLDIIEYVCAKPGGVIAQEIAADLAIPVSSLSYLLSTLIDRQYLRRDGRRYAPGEGLRRLQRIDEAATLDDRARPLIRALRVHLNETSSFFRRCDWAVEAVVTETAEQTLQYSIAVGRRTPLHCVAGGKAVLATLPADELDRYFAENTLTPFTARTICDRAALLAELEQIRDQGFAKSIDEYVAGICAIGVAVRDGDDVIGAVSVAVPTSRFTPDVEAAVVGSTRRTATLLERRAQGGT